MMSSTRTVIHQNINDTISQIRLKPKLNVNDTTTNNRNKVLHSNRTEGANLDCIKSASNRQNGDKHYEPDSPQSWINTHWVFKDMSVHFCPKSPHCGRCPGLVQYWRHFTSFRGLLPPLAWFHSSPQDYGWNNLLMINTYFEVQELCSFCCIILSKLSQLCTTTSHL